MAPVPVIPVVAFGVKVAALLTFNVPLIVDAFVTFKDVVIDALDKVKPMLASIVKDLMAVAKSVYKIVLFAPA